MKKALLITVGTGVGKQKDKVVESLANGIAFSIRTHSPTKVVFLVTKESETTTLPKVLEKTNLNEDSYVIYPIKEMDDIGNVYQESVFLLEKLIEKEGFPPKDIVVDYTSGTKAMSAGLSIAAALSEVENLSYISGKREGGIVIQGTERIITLRPYEILVDKQVKSMKELFNVHQFEACIKIINQLKKKTKDSAIHEKLGFCEKICTAYSLWDKFNHDEAWSILEPIKHKLIAKNKAFLGQLSTLKTNEADQATMPFHISDLINNAERRSHEGKYDDAVARLYRCMELLAQYELFQLGIDSSNVDINKLPDELQAKYEELRDEDGKIKLGLRKDFELLADRVKDIGKNFLKNKELQNLLKSRNASILAHGFRHVEKETYSKLLKYVNEYAESSVSDIEKLKDMATFPTFEKLV